MTLLWVFNIGRLGRWVFQKMLCRRASAGKQSYTAPFNLYVIQKVTGISTIDHVLSRSR